MSNQSFHPQLEQIHKLTLQSEFTKAQVKDQLKLSLQKQKESCYSNSKIADEYAQCIHKLIGDNKQQSQIFKFKTIYIETKFQQCIESSKSQQEFEQCSENLIQQSQILIKEVNSLNQ